MRSSISTFTIHRVYIFIIFLLDFYPLAGLLRDSVIIIRMHKRWMERKMSGKKRDEERERNIYIYNIEREESKRRPLLGGKLVLQLN